MTTWTPAATKRPLPAEQRPENAITKAQADKAVVEKDLVPLVDLDVPAVLPQCFGIVGGLLIETDVVQLDFPVTLEDRGVGVAEDVRVSVVATVDCSPLARPYTSRQPENGATGKIQSRAHGDRTVREGPVQVHRGEQKGELARNQAREDNDQDFGHEVNVSPRPPLPPSKSR